MNKTIDALTKLRHDCDRHELDFTHLDAIAYQRYIEESDARRADLERGLERSFWKK